MNFDEFSRALKDCVNKDEQHMPKPLPEAVTHDLRYKFEKLNTKHEFAVGDIVGTKEGMGFYKSAGRPHIVSAIGAEKVEAMLGFVGPRGHDTPIVCKDMAVCFIDEDGDFIEFAVDSRHFEPWPDAVTEDDQKVKP